ncbi:MAG: hypothetical protein HKN23_00380 [Verrucomicrobiales bacterium]|nr:hypothetical protein [Verrucomicrobiales bacterium]
MKKLILTAAIVVAGFFTFAPTAEAGGLRIGVHIGGHGHGGHGHCSPRLIRTYEICRRCETRYRYDRCGRKIRFHVTVVTYKSVYSNGYSRTFTRTFYS